MIPLSRINQHELERTVRLFNESGLLSESIQTIGYTKLDLIKVFSYEVEHFKNPKVLPKQVREFYNFIYQDEDMSGKKIKPKLERNISIWGAVEGSQAYILDEMISTGGFTVEEMARACCTNLSRVRRHLHGRKKQLNFHYLICDRKYYVKPNDEGTNELQKNRRVVQGFDF